jgi:hypothetical protein
MTAYQPERWHDMFVAMAGGVILAGTLPTVAAGISVLVRGGGGLYWLVAALILGFRRLGGQRVDPAGRDPSLTRPAGVPVPWLARRGGR